MSAMVAKTPGRPRARGPVELGLEMGFGLLFITLFAWFIGMMIEIVGSFTLWRDLQENHAQQIVEQDLEYIAQAPRSLLVRDTVALTILPGSPAVSAPLSPADGATGLGTGVALQWTGGYISGHTSGEYGSISQRIIRGRMDWHFPVQCCGHWCCTQRS